MRRKFILLLTGCLVSLAALSHANDDGLHFTLMPFGGYRFNGSATLNDPNYSRVDFGDSSVFGMAAGVEVEEGLVEIMWTHQDTNARAIPVSGGPPSESLDINADQFHFNGLYFPPEFEHFRPYVLAGLGVTHYAPTGDIESISRFSWALGGGVQLPLSPRWGLRLEAKWDPAVQTSSESIFCNSATGRCFVTSSGNLIDQFDFTAGLSLRI